MNNIKEKNNISRNNNLTKVKGINQATRTIRLQDKDKGIKK